MTNNKELNGAIEELDDIYYLYANEEIKPAEKYEKVKELLAQRWEKTIDECINVIDEMNGIDIGDEFDIFTQEIKKRLLALRSEGVVTVR